MGFEVGRVGCVVSQNKQTQISPLQINVVLLLIRVVTVFQGYKQMPNDIRRGVSGLQAVSWCTNSQCIWLFRDIHWPLIMRSLLEALGN